MDREDRQAQRQAQRNSLLAGTPFGGPAQQETAAKKPKPKKPKKPKTKKPKKPQGATPGLNQGVSDAYHREESGGNPTLGYGSWVDPNHSYGSGYGAGLPTSQLKTGAGQKQAENDPRALFNHHLSIAGLPTRSTSRFGQFLQGQFFDELQAGYNQAKQYNNMLTFDRYIRGLGGGSATQMQEGAAPAPTTGTTKGQKGKKGKGKGKGNTKGKSGGVEFNKSIQESVPKNLPPKQRAKAIEREKARREKIRANHRAANSKTGTKAVDPRYGDPNERLDPLARRTYLALPPSLRGLNGAIYGAGDTAWSAFR